MIKEFKKTSWSIGSPVYNYGDLLLNVIEKGMNSLCVMIGLAGVRSG